MVGELFQIIMVEWIDPFFEFLGETSGNETMHQYAIDDVFVILNIRVKKVLIF